MSDADNQMGGTGGERGRAPDDVEPGRDNAAPAPDDKHRDESKKDDQADDESAQSFPASDPPANY